jgi:hypothetical protein
MKTTLTPSKESGVWSVLLTGSIIEEKRRTVGEIYNFFIVAYESNTLIDRWIIVRATNKKPGIPTRERPAC